MADLSVSATFFSHSIHVCLAFSLAVSLAVPVFISRIKQSILEEEKAYEAEEEEFQRQQRKVNEWSRIFSGVLETYFQLCAAFYQEEEKEKLFFVYLLRSVTNCDIDEQVPADKLVKTHESIVRQMILHTKNLWQQQQRVQQGNLTLFHFSPYFNWAFFLLASPSIWFRLSWQEIGLPFKNYSILGEEKNKEAVEYYVFL